MAAWTVTTEIATISAATGQDYTAIAADLGIYIGIERYAADGTIDGLFVSGRRDYERVEAAAAKWARAMNPTPARPAASAGAPLATERQVSYILTILARGAGDEGGYISGGPTTRDQIARLTRRQASDYIDSLTGRY